MAPPDSCSNLSSGQYQVRHQGTLYGERASAGGERQLVVNYSSPLVHIVKSNSMFKFELSLHKFTSSWEELAQPFRDI